MAAKQSIRSSVSAGVRIGRWTVVSGPYQSGPRPQGPRPQWECRCDCGAIKRVDQENLVSGHSRGCVTCRRLHANKKHGMCGTPIYRVWMNMIARCENPKHKNYARYGGRGIKICSRWRNSFGAFYGDMGLQPTLTHEIDRINNDGNYEPGNCRWATRSQQRRNMSKTIRVTCNGSTKSLHDWADELGFDAGRVYFRMYRGLSFSEAISLPDGRVGSGRYNTRLTDDDVKLIRRLRAEGWKLKDLAERFKIFYTAIQKICSRESWKHVT